MKTNELRIGNWVFDSDQLEEFTIESDTLFDESDGDCMEKHIKPIPLTEEWLEKFGFERKGFHFNKYGLQIIIADENDFLIEYSFSGIRYNNVNLVVRIKHIHQLQNLYFALTGEELKLTN